jgi:hypothetical protein
MFPVAHFAEQAVAGGLSFSKHQDLKPHLPRESCLGPTVPSSGNWGLRVSTPESGRLCPGLDLNPSLSHLFVEQFY